MIGLDTSTIIDFFKGNESLGHLLNGLSEQFVLNEISYLEIMFGLNLNNPKHQIEEAFYDNLFHHFSNLSLSASASKKASKIFQDLKKSGKTIEAFDCAIAGILLVNGVNKIITKNVKHFKKIKNLKVISY